MPLPIFESGLLRQLANTLSDAATHRELSHLFASSGIEENGGAPKWERILFALSARQEQDRCGNNVGAFLEGMMAPVRFVADKERFSSLRNRLNEILAFSGLQIGENGRLHAVQASSTLSEAQARAGRLESELERRRVHPFVLRFCRAELLKENYFHAILEATKSVADKIRARTGLTADGAELVDAAFSIKKPLLAMNSLQTESEQSEQKGFGNLLKGVFGTFRNPTAHSPKIRLTYSEQDALDLLTLVSYLHRMIDSAIRTPFSI